MRYGQTDAQTQLSHASLLCEVLCIAKLPAEAILLTYHMLRVCILELADRHSEEALQ